MTGIKDVLLEVKRLAKDNGLSEPYIVGGLPRDKILNRINKVEDIDLTSGDESIHQLAELTAQKFRVNPIRFPDQHYQLYIEGIKYDFSSNYNSPDAAYFLEKAGIAKPTPMILELFSRDFTCNTLIIPLALRKIIDPTGLALDDIKKKIIRTALPPRITLRDDPKRVVRVIYLAAKLGFTVEKDIITWVRAHHDQIKQEVSVGFAKRKLADATRADVKKTVQLMNAMDLWNVIGIPRILAEHAGTARGL
jgi:tRNA nucleotidyltransferase/poly(A) polymerase